MTLIGINFFFLLFFFLLSTPLTGLNLLPSFFLEILSTQNICTRPKENFHYRNLVFVMCFQVGEGKQIALYFVEAAKNNNTSFEPCFARCVIW